MRGVVAPDLQGKFWLFGPFVKSKVAVLHQL
jgi:hypothetical protein